MVSAIYPYVKLPQFFGKPIGIVNPTDKLSPHLLDTEKMKLTNQLIEWKFIKKGEITHCIKKKTHEKLKRKPQESTRSPIYSLESYLLSNIK